MAKKSGSTIVQEELYPQADESLRDELDDSRALDLDVEKESPFLRGQKRVSVRRGSLPKKTATRLTWALLAAGVLFVGGLAVAALYHYGEQSWRFRINSSDEIEISGLGNVTRSQVMEVMGGDIGRNIFFIPLSQRQKQLEQIPWVESASVMRFVPNRLRIEIHERTPVAFARIGSRISLLDAEGTLMDLPVGTKHKYSFPVILGMNSGEPASTRAARMKTYTDLVSQLDSSGAHYSQELSEVDISDADDVKVLANNPQGEVLLHLGSADYLERYKIYVSHVQEWRQQFSRLESVDLRYDRQIIVNPDLQGPPKQVPLSPASAKAAVSAGVKPAVLISHEAVAAKATSAAKPVPVKKVAKGRHKKPALRKASATSRITSPAKPAFGPPVAGGQTPPKTVVGPPVAGGQSTTPAKSTAQTPAANNSAVTVAAKPGGKPSPAIPKTQDDQ
jgi:cell division protein FtsQ